MRIAKADDDDFKATRSFLHACENSLEKEKFSFVGADEQWLTWEDEDEDKILMMEIRKQLAKELYSDEEDVDNRLVIYEWLKEKFRKASNAWHRITMAADTLIENVCDPTVDYLSFHPGFEYFHVANEQ